MRSMFRKAGAIASGLALAVGLAVVAPTAANAAEVSTPYAYSSRAFGTYVSGGQLPATSGTTAKSQLSCTNNAGRSNINELATVNLPGGLGSLGSVVSKSWTTKDGTNAYSSHALDQIASVSLKIGVATLKLEGIRAEATSTWNGSAFVANQVMSAGKITLNGIPLVTPKVGSSISVPGVGKLEVGVKASATSAHGAKSKAIAVRLTIAATNTVVRIGVAESSIFDGVTTGTFKGRSHSVQVTLLDGTVKTSPQIDTRMPCQGTYGATRTASAATLSVPGVVSISAAKNTQYAKQDSTGASAYEMNQVGQVTVANGALVIEGLVTRANLSRKAGGTSVLDTNGTTAAKITLNGKVLSLSALNNLEIPGIAKIRTNVVTKSTNQIDVIGVQLQLLDGSNTYVNLSRATVGITPKS